MGRTSEPLFTWLGDKSRSSRVELSNYGLPVRLCKSASGCKRWLSDEILLKLSLTLGEIIPASAAITDGHAESIYSDCESDVRLERSNRSSASPRLISHRFARFLSIKSA